MTHDTNPPQELFKTIPIASINIDAGCIRTSDTDIVGLKNTISDVGLLQPIIVRTSGDAYTVIDGHRRLKVLKELNVTELIVGREVIVDVDETEADYKFKQIIANIQREDFSDIELGYAFVALKQVYGYQYNEIADIIGKTRHYVTAKVNLATRLTKEVQEQVTFDLDNAKVLKETINDQVQEPYVMNVNVIETIARLPERLQSAVYNKVKAEELDKDQALTLIRAVKSEAEGANELIKTYLEAQSTYPNDLNVELYKYVKKVHKDMDMLVEKIKTDDKEDREKLLPVIESLIEKLSSICLEIKGEKIILDDDKDEVRSGLISI
jgi:ParB family chromosome partitioning protein